ncbi:MAG TPA: MFS transporter [Rhizomicrobium sp.]|jgi:ACS family glucarate transporter-like MFS transporter|nr:MFS transporter [Rhizomicrobium sp.]
MKSRIRYLLIIWIFVVSAVVYIDRTNITVASLSLSKDYGIGAVELGWVFSAFLAGYAIFQIPAGWVVGKLGPRLTLALGLVWWAVFSAAVALVPPAMGGALWVLIGVRFVLGMGEAVAYPASNQFIAAWFPSNERGIANGWVFGGVGFGAAISQPLVAAIMLDFGWRAVFWFSAGIGLVVGLLWYWFARDTPQQHPKVGPEELALIKAGLPEKVEGPMPPVPWGKIFTSRDVWAVTIAYFAFGYVAFIFLNWFFYYLAKGRGIEIRTSAFMAMLPFISMTVCCLAGGVISDWLVKRWGQYFGRCIYGAFTLVLTGCFLIVGSQAQDATVAVLVLAGGAGALYLGQATYWAVAADYGGPHTGVISGLINMGGQIAGVITATATPWLATRYGWSSAFYVAAGVSFVCAVAWFFANPDKRLTPAGEQPEQVTA